VPVLISIAECRFMPGIIRRMENDEKEKLSLGIRKLNKAVIVFALPAAIVLIVLGRMILQLFGTAFIAGYVPLIILVAGQLINVRRGLFMGILRADQTRSISALPYALG